MDKGIQFGYACINETLADREIFVNSGCIAKTFKDKGKEYVTKLVENNLKAVIKILYWNERHGIRLYRLSSAMFPQLTNPEFITENEKYSYQLEQFAPILKRIGELAYNFEHRLTFHPDHYVQLASPREDVLAKSILDLQYHADVLNLMGCDRHSVLILHTGGVYGDKKRTMKRWVKRFCSLNGDIRDRLVLENCEHNYSIEDTIWISNKIKKKIGRPAPCVFDTHHDECYRILHEDHGLDEPRDYMERILETWDANDIVPKFHVSEQAPNKRIGAHSRYVRTIPEYLFDIAHDRRVDVMIEAKEKEKAVLYLKDKYGI